MLLQDYAHREETGGNLQITITTTLELEVSGSTKLEFMGAVLKILGVGVDQCCKVSQIREQIVLQGKLANSGSCLAAAPSCPTLSQPNMPQVTWTL